MSMISTRKNTIGELASVWRQVGEARGSTVEFSYRLEKLALRLESIADKIFIKTVKAHKILTECRELTDRFKSELHKSHHTALRLLTHLESCMDNLVKDTHEFRVKAG